MKKIFYSWWYGHKFIKGYTYTRIRNTNLDLLEKHHYLMIDLGWQQDGEIKSGFKYAWCWYRKKDSSSIRFIV